MKPKICKCGHKKDEHEKFFLLNYQDCTKCRCSYYLKRERPDKTDKFLSVLLICGIGIIWSMVIMGSVMVSFLDENALNEPVKLTKGEYIDQLFIILILGSLIYSAFIFPFDYFMQKRRRIHDTDDK